MLMEYLPSYGRANASYIQPLLDSCDSLTPHVGKCSGQSATTVISIPLVFVPFLYRQGAEFERLQRGKELFRRACVLAGRSRTPQSAQLFGHASSPLRETTRKASAAANLWKTTAIIGRYAQRLFAYKAWDLLVLHSGRGRPLMLDIHTYVPVPHASLERTNTLAMHRVLGLGSRCSLNLVALAAIQMALSPTCAAETSWPSPQSFNSVGPRACSFRRRRPISIKRPSVCFILLTPFSRIFYSLVSSLLISHYRLSSLRKVPPTANHFAYY